MAKDDKEKDDTITMAAILDRLISVQQESQAVQKTALAQNAPKSWTQVPNISPYNWRGEKDYPMPKLKCEINAPFPLLPELHSLTREEVELFNLLVPGTYRIELVDGSTQIVNVVGTRNQISGKLEVMGLFGEEDPEHRGRYNPLFTHFNKQQFPALTKMLREMVGEPADAVMTMAEEKRRTQLPADDPRHLAVSIGG